MNSFSAEERLALRESVHRLLSKGSDERAVRATMDTPGGYDSKLWQELAGMGVVGLIVDEAHGGAGVGPMELELVMEEVGAALLCSPFLASSVLAAALLHGLADEELNDRLLPGIAEGSCIATAAVTGRNGCWTPDGVTVSGQEVDGEWRLDGCASFVVHGQSADVLLVLANTSQGFKCFVVESGAAGVGMTALPTFDHTLRLTEITFEGVKAEHVAAQIPAWDAVARAMDLTLVALAGEQAGAAQRCLSSTVEYAKTRIQFGRAIGSFQAVKHMAADLLLETESSISAARNAAASLAEDADGAAEAVSLAAFACADAFVATAATSIQMHGGIAFTWEHPAHLYLRRARADAQLFGSSSFHRERFIQALGA
ncbi:MAG: acyl-CoA dehydrogenase [bacterium]|nr:acyl-CoA dehydrogenase [bacterium]